MATFIESPAKISAMIDKRKYLLILVMAALILPWCAVRYLSNQENLLKLRRVLCVANSSCISFSSLFTSNSTNVSDTTHVGTNATHVGIDATDVGTGGTSTDFPYIDMSKTSVLDEFYFFGNHVAMKLPNQTSPSDLPPYKFIIIDWTMYLSSSDWKPIVSGNCLVTRNKTLAPSSDAIAIVSRKLSKLSALPQVRKPSQRWVWVLDETPFHPLDGQPFGLDNLRDIFNWTMTYRSDSDVYIPYGYTFKLQKPGTIDDKSLFDSKSNLAAAVISNCGAAYNHNGRFTYVKELQKSMPVTIYGRCGTPCPGRLSSGQLASPCQEITKFKFFLAFENSNCKEYISEKMFIHGLSVGVVPVVMGAQKTDYIKLAPPNSFIFAGDFAKPEDLAKYLVDLASNKKEYMKFHEWRRYFGVKYRIQYYDDLIWAPLCQELNAVSNPFKIQSARYPSLKNFWDLNRDCDLSRNFL